MSYYNEAVNEYADVACLTVLTFELLDTFKDEIEFIWKQKWTATKFLYIVSRYFPFVAFTIFFLCDRENAEEEDEYKRWKSWNYADQSKMNGQKKAAEFVFNFNLAIVEALFTLRAWALWHRSKKIGFFLVALFWALWTPILACFILLAVDILDLSHFIQINFGCLALFYLATSMLMSIRAYHVLANTKGARFLRMAHSQGLVYYLFLLFISTFAFICALIFGEKVHILVPRILQLFFSVMATRMTLNLRKLATRTVRGPGINTTDGFDVSTFRAGHTRVLDVEANTALTATVLTLPTLTPAG